LGGTVFAVFAPLPPLPLPVFPEETFFAAHRADFEQVVTLARQDQLKCELDRGCGMMGRSLPPEYRSLSVNGVVQVIPDPSSGLSVAFRPIDYDYPMIYFENPDPENWMFNSFCSPEAGFTKKLDDHWYLCAEELWN
jgi:hypothetical protein